MVDGQENLGGVTPEELAEYSKTTVGPPGIANVSPEVQFVTHVAELVTHRTKAGEAGEFAIFLLCERVRKYEQHCSGASMPFLRNGHDPILGFVWIASAPLGDTRKTKIVAKDAGHAFTEISGGELASLPAIFVDWKSNPPKAAFYPEGLQTPENMFSIDLSGNRITENDMKTALDHFYQKRFAAPQLVSEGGGTRIWKAAARGIPEELVEGRIQGRLIDTLQSRFPHHNLRGEAVVAEGRADVIVWKKTLDAYGDPVARNDWVLELKALREKTTTDNPVSNTTCRNAVSEGLSQVVRYRNKVPALNAAVCCYDMRKENEGDANCFKPIKKEALDQNVHTWRWYLYRSARQLRAAIKTGELVEI